METTTSRQNEPKRFALRIDGVRWRRSDENRQADRSDGLTLAPGTITLLIGANGAGKSTLLEKMAGLRPPEDLQVSFGAVEIWKRRKSGKAGARPNAKALLNYSYASQAPEEALFARTVRDELEYSMRPYGLSVKEREQRSEFALRAIGWDEGWLERDPYLMSGGERRRMALAAAFAAPAPWLFLDEPTAGLDGAGHETIADQLSRMRSEGTGVVLVSHDSDWALPLADQVMLLKPSGSIVLCAREQLIEKPELLTEAGMRVSEWLRTVHHLWRNGVPAELLWHPKEAAEAWPVRDETEVVEVLPEGQGALSPLGKEIAPRIRQGVRHRLSGFDPRSVWLAYILLSVGIYRLGDWIGILIGAAIVAALLGAGNVSLRRWRVVIVNYAIFSVATSAIFAWGASGEWNVRGEAFAATLFPFSRTMLILLIGLAIPLVMSPLSLRRSLEQLTSIRGRSPVWAQRMILTVALIMRFVPVLLELWERFAKIIRARGKSVSRNPAAMGRRLRDTAIPFLLALFRLGDEVALALESRGVGGSVQPTCQVRMRWRGRDYALAAGSLGLAIGLWAIGSR
ncbi:ATP-binding cassette domain-containing protein [Cohnella terricola]|uniref:ATP-binding cassette domain-containing protein n=1 Tax=Cohnella terricola TaxID=1289167 RepID=A0A559JCI3_9BACL|nr:ATP-binding cassette domain-containing protein [Cohnella terricola]TVX97581.1 ATP-binding cassette domain-containing protein [Cohnella terricola]